jgi:hypothetical protein
MNKLSYRENLVVNSTFYVGRGLAEAYLRNISLQMQLTDDVYSTPWECAKEVGFSYDIWKGVFFRGVRGITPKIVDIPTEKWIGSYLTKLPGIWQSFFSNTIGATLTLVFGYPLDVHIIKLINEWENMRQDNLKLNDDDHVNKRWIDRICDNYSGLGAAWARMMVYFSVFHLLYMGMEWGLPSKSHEMRLLKRFILELGADMAAYPLGTIQRTQVVEKKSLMEAIEKNKEEREFYRSYHWHFCISLGVVLIGFGAFKLKRVYTGVRCK